MFKSLIPGYLICFGLYLLFTRQPDYIDGEFAPGIIHRVYDSVSHRQKQKVVYQDGLRTYDVVVDYPFCSWENGEKVMVIYENNAPDKAAVYQVWGYWIKWDECLISAILCIGLYALAIAVAGKPSGMASEVKDLKKRKYDD